ncbi:transcriptional repressor [Alsobacter soli]|uniref:Ferric uptake regulation protein n=1 Tax=Alsobacter soli TaxID=2109933 RepID=A0A2T1HQU7_9HYPH|nr:Fur family transcriptional regulator [Alsobacter soli]PSC03889.1 transcriptional repressor [Alsobacter soli]
MTELNRSASRPGVTTIVQPRAPQAGALSGVAPGWPNQSGCLFHDLRGKLRQAGLRPTRQRVGLGWLLFSKGDRHLTAEQLYEEATKARVPVSLATIYNTLHQFTEAGLLREVAVEGAKTYFDTNVSNHHHFFVEGENTLHDIEGDQVKVASLPEPPEGMEIARVDVIVRLRKKKAR